MAENSDPSVLPQSPELDASADRAERKSNEKRKHRVEFIAAILIAVAAVFTAFATNAGSQVDGEVERLHTESIRLSLIANDAYNDFTAERASERDWFFSAMTEVENDTDAADYLIDAMPDSVWALFEEWDGTDDQILDPFSPEASYVALAGLPSTSLLQLGNEIAVEAECAIFAAGAAESRGENYGLATVALAIALVVGGIAAVLTSKPAQVIVLVVSALSLVGGIGLYGLAEDPDEAWLDQAQIFFAEDEEGNELTPVQSLAAANKECAGLELLA